MRRAAALLAGGQKVPTGARTASVLPLCYPGPSFHRGRTRVTAQVVGDRVGRGTWWCGDAAVVCPQGLHVLFSSSCSLS